MKTLICFLMMTIPAAAAAEAGDLTVNEKDQTGILALCDAAAVSPYITRENRAAVSNWCVQWAMRISKAPTAPTGPTAHPTRPPPPYVPDQVPPQPQKHVPRPDVPDTAPPPSPAPK